MKLFSGWRKRTQLEAAAAPAPPQWKSGGGGRVYDNDGYMIRQRKDENEEMSYERKIEITGMLAIGTMGAIRCGGGGSEEENSKGGGDDRSIGAAAAAVIHKYDMDCCSVYLEDDDMDRDYRSSGINGQGSPFLQELLASSLYICSNSAGFRQAPPPDFVDDAGGNCRAAAAAKTQTTETKTTAAMMMMTTTATMNNKKKNSSQQGLRPPPPPAERLLEMKGLFWKWPAFLSCLARQYTTSPPGTPGGLERWRGRRRRHCHRRRGGEDGGDFVPVSSSDGVLLRRRRRVFLQYCYQIFHKFDSRKCQIKNISSGHKNEEMHENHLFDRRSLQECRVSLHPHIIFDHDNVHNNNSSNTAKSIMSNSLTSTCSESSIKENEASNVDDNYIDGHDLKAWLKYITRETTNANSSYDQEYHPYQQHQKHTEHQQEYDGDEVNYIHIDDLGVHRNPLVDQNAMNRYLISTNDEFVIIEL